MPLHLPCHSRLPSTNSCKLERGWIAVFGPPQQLVTDEGRAWLGHDFENWTSVHGVDHIVAPGEAHERLALVERRHAVLRKAIEVYLDDLKLDHADGIREALTYCTVSHS